MTGADVARFALIIALGFFAFLTFIFASTVVGLMWLESSQCKCWELPVGIYVLALIGILFLISITSEIIDAWPELEWLVDHRRDAVIVTVIFLIIIILILI
jgi:hypothetical protein